jgi:membrane protein
VKQTSFLSLLRQVARKVGQADVTQVAASMAFYTAFSLFPLLLLLISVGSLLLKDRGTVNQILRFVGETLPGTQFVVNENISNILEQRGSIGVFGLVTLLWSASNVFTTLSAHINSAWPDSAKRNFLEKRLIGLGIVAAMVIALIGYILGIGFLQLLVWMRVLRLGDADLMDPEAWGWVWSLLSWTLVFILLSGIYRWVPKIRVPWKAALTSGLIVTLVLLVLSRILAGLLTLIIERYELVYGSLSAFVAFLFYIYLTNLVVLIGAHISATLAVYIKRAPEVKVAPEKIGKT